MVTYCVTKITPTCSPVTGQFFDTMIAQRSDHAKIYKINGTSAGVLTIYTGEPEIPVGKSNGLRHPVWEASENMGCNMR